MGCDFFYKGSLEDHRLQKKVIELAAQFWTDGFRVHPEPETWYRTKMKTNPLSNEKRAYPFNFFGYVPFPDSDLLEYGQFIFDRTDGGRLVTLSKLPAVYEIEGMLPNDDAGSEEVCVKRNGHIRGPASYSFGLLFYMIRSRYFSDFSVSDDYNVCRETEYLVDQFRISDAVMDDKVTFDACRTLFDSAYEKYRSERGRT